MQATEKTMDQIVALCKNRGFVYAGSEIYGGLSNAWDYGPLGVEFKNNIKRAWWKKFVQESPYNVGLDAAFCGKDHDVAVQHAQRTLHFHREVHVAGGVNDIDAAPFPEAGGRGGSDGDAALLLLRHPVHGGVAVMDLAHFMIDSGIIQDTLRRRCLTGIDMGRNADIPY